MAELQARYVTYRDDGGLGNRLRLHFLAHAYALKTGRKLVVNWRRNIWCYAKYHDLFVGGPPSLKSCPLWEQFLLRFVYRLDRHSFGSGTLPTKNDDIQSLVDLPNRIVHFTSQVESWTRSESRLGPYHQEVISSLQPLPEISAKCGQFMCKLISPTVGIHIRLGDFITKYGDNLPKIERYSAIIEHLSELIPNLVFIIVSDEQTDQLASIIDNKARIMRPRVVDRNTLEGIKDALSDLLILASTDLIVSTPYSSFGGVAALIGGKPLLRASENWKLGLKKLQFIEMIQT